MHFETTYRLEDFILHTRWEDLPAAVRERMKGCFVDLTGALTGAEERYVQSVQVWPEGDGLVVFER